MNQQPAASIDYEIESFIDGSTRRVWDALTKETNDWWLPDFHMVASDSVVTLDLRPGGHLVEQHPGGGGLLWYTVQMFVPGESLDLVGDLSPRFGGPSISMLGWKLETEGSGTRLSMREGLLGNVTRQSAESAREGWGQLIGSGLKPHVEAR